MRLAVLVIVCVAGFSLPWLVVGAQMQADQEVQASSIERQSSDRRAVVDATPNLASKESGQAEPYSRAAVQGESNPAE